MEIEYGKWYPGKNKIAIDIFRVIFAVLVIGIHTEPFGFNVWLDRGFGIVTRLCVPFFFVVGSFFLFSCHQNIIRYLKRIVVLYIVWSIIYLPFSINYIATAKFLDILLKYFWYGNEYALWYLWGTVIATIVVVGIIRLSDSNSVAVLGVSFSLFLVGLLGSTWSPLIKNTAGGGLLCNVVNLVGARTGLFYGSVYVALGWHLASRRKLVSRKKCLIGFAISVVALSVESLLFVVLLKTNTTILWLSVIPAVFFGVQYLLQCQIRLNFISGKLLREISSLMYVSQYLFITLFREFANGFLLFVVVVISALFFAVIVIWLSRKIRLFKALY